VASSLAAFLSWKSDIGRLTAGALIALAILTRPEGAILLPAVLIYLWLDRPEGAKPRSMSREAILLAAPGAVALAAQVALSVAVTDSWSPGTATAKMHFFQEYNHAFSEKIRISGDLIGLFAGSIFSLLVLAAVGARRKEAVLFGLFGLPLLALYVMLLPGGLGHYFHRYQHPLLPVIAVLAGGGLAAMISAVLTRGIVEKALLVAVLIVLAIPMWQQYENWRDAYGGAVFDLRRIEAMAIDLNEVIGPNERLAAHDIGAIGYYADYEIVDLVGLVNPKVVPYNQDRALNTYIDGVRPDYLLTFPEWDSWFLWLGAGDRPANFELVKRYEHSLDTSPYYLYRIHYPLE
jgi:hypothetical protein